MADEFRIGDYVCVDYINHTMICGEIVKILDTGFTLQLSSGLKLAISFSRLNNICIVHKKGEDMYDEINKFASANLNKNVTIETDFGVGYIGVLTRYVPNNFVEVKTDLATIEIRMDRIVKYYANSDDEDLLAKQIIADLVGGTTDESLHSLAKKLLFGNDKQKHEFKYVDVSDEFKLSKMPSERFKELLDELDGNSLQTLKEKNARYSTDGDCLHNFRSGAEVAGGTPAQACWGYMTKHLVALRDMVMRNDFSNREDFLEKCQDTINYIRFLWCIGNDASNSENEEKESN